MHSIRFDADSKLIDFIQKKLDKLDRYFDRIVDCDVIMRIDNDNARENKIIEFKLNIPKDQLFAKARARTFESATDEAAANLKRQLKKYKEKLTAH